MDDLIKFRARVGNHNLRLIYLDPADKPEGERGGGSENMAAVITWRSPEDSAELAEWLVGVINGAIYDLGVMDRANDLHRRFLGELED